MIDNACQYLAFDPSVFTYNSANLGTGDARATMDVNASQTSSGKLAVVLALPIGTTFPLGAEEVVRVNLSPASSALGTFTLALTDQPVVRQVVDPTATPLTASYINGSVVVNPLPTLSIARAQADIALSWPLWATNFRLQEATGPLLPSLNWTNVPVTFVISNSEAVVTQPLSATTKFYRLRKP